MTRTKEESKVEITNTIQINKRFQTDRHQSFLQYHFGYHYLSSITRYIGGDDNIDMAVEEPNNNLNVIPLSPPPKTLSLRV